jgi:hypothetical protein
MAAAAAVVCGVLTDEVARRSRADEVGGFYVYNPALEGRKEERREVRKGERKGGRHWKDR